MQKFEQPDERDVRLDAMFRAYRRAHGDWTADPNFMPQLWNRIDRSRKGALRFQRIAQGFVTAAVALSLLMAGLLSAPRYRSPEVYQATYVETLAVHHVMEGNDFDPADDPVDLDLL